jgi:hypothetical protein
MAATIGALRVVLGADTAQFERGLKGAQTQLGFFGKNAALAGAALGAAVGAAAVSLGVAIKKTIDQADELGKVSQKIGIPVEELSRLKHAADLSGVSFEGLTTSFGRLSRNMAEVAAGASGPAAQAFRTLGIEVQNADGTLKASSDVMKELASRFAGMRDGAAKTALAVQLFGRAGADLIPLLNSGADGLDKMMREADELGIVITDKTAKAAEQFNDNLTRLQRVGDSLVVGVVNEWTPALAGLSGILVDASKGARELSGAMGALIGQQEPAVTFFDHLEGAVRRFMNPLGAAIAGYQTLKNLVAEQSTLPPLAFGDFTMPERVAESIEPVIVNQKALAAAAREANSAIEWQNQKFQEAASIYQSTLTPAEAYAQELIKLRILHDEAGKAAFDLAKAEEKVAEQAGNTWHQAGASIAGSFADIGQAFGKESKTMAKVAKIAGAIQATISMFTGAAKALELPFPANLAAMAVVLAQGAALVANIRSQAVPSFAHGGSFTVPGGISGVDNVLMPMALASGERVDITPAGQASRSATQVNLTLNGMAYSRDQLRYLIDQINRYAADGGPFIRVKCSRW